MYYQLYKYFWRSVRRFKKYICGLHNLSYYNIIIITTIVNARIADSTQDPDEYLFCVYSEFASSEQGNKL